MPPVLSWQTCKRMSRAVDLLSHQGVGHGTAVPFNPRGFTQYRSLKRISRAEKEANMLRQVIATLVVPALVVTTAVIGQSVVATGQSEGSTIAGCLQAGTKEGEFVLVADDKQTYQIQPADGLELAPHANHRVELTGTIEKTETSSVLKAKALKMVATSCEA